MQMKGRLAGGYSLAGSTEESDRRRTVTTAQWQKGTVTEKPQTKNRPVAVVPAPRSRGRVSFHLRLHFGFMCCRRTCRLISSGLPGEDQAAPEVNNKEFQSFTLQRSAREEGPAEEVTSTGVCVLCVVCVCVRSVCTQNNQRKRSRNVCLDVLLRMI